MRYLYGILAFSIAAGTIVQAAPPDPILVNSQAVVLSFDAGGASGVERAEVWVRSNATAVWTVVESVRVSDGAVRFETDHDGRHECYLSLHNSAGRSAPPPTDQSEPHVIVVVDTAPPTLQVHRTYAVESDNRTPLLRLDVSLSEENLGAGGLRLFYRNASGDEWRDGGAVTCGGGMIEWRMPADVAELIDVRLVATDLAGNRAMEATLGVRATPPVRKSDPPVSTQPAEEAVGEFARRMIPTSQPDISSAVASPEPGTPSEDKTADAAQPAAFEPADPRCDVLRRQAERFLAEGRLALAGARLRDALDLSPDDPDVNADLGRVLFRTGQNAESGHRFQLALNVDPNHEVALEGLALAEFTQRRYSDARERLLRLIQLRPDNGEHWLRYGDVEHLLGNREQATAAWEKAMASNSGDADLRGRAERRVKQLSGRIATSE